MKNPHPWKVPFRQVVCATFGGWLKATLWCHVVIRIWPHAQDLGVPMVCQRATDADFASWPKPA